MARPPTDYRTPTMTYADDNGITLTAQTGRDISKQFRIPEIPPTETVTFVLRLLAAVQLSGVDELTDIMNGNRSDSDASNAERIASIMRLLSGCDPTKVRALITDALSYITIAPDPNNRMFRKLEETDIKEMKTLGELLNAFVRVNVMPAV